MGALCLVGCPFDFDPGHAPDVVAEPGLAVCERRLDPLEGSCLADLGAGCFEPAGACLPVTIDSGAGLAWENGAVLSFQPSAVNAAVKEITAYAPDGSLCFSALSAADSQSAVVRTRFAEKSGAGYILFEDAGGNVQITCPDGSVESVEVTDFHLFYQCLYGGDGDACDFAAVAALGARNGRPPSAIGACSNTGDCPAGTSCCGVGTGAAYCSPICL